MAENTNDSTVDVPVNDNSTVDAPAAEAAPDKVLAQDVDIDYTAEPDPDEYVPTETDVIREAVSQLSREVAHLEDELAAARKALARAQTKLNEMQVKPSLVELNQNARRNDRQRQENERRIREALAALGKDREHKPHPPIGNVDVGR